MTIHWQWEKSSPRSVVTGESDQIAGSHMRDAIHPRNSNVLQFLPKAKEPSNSRPSQAALSIDDADRETGVACVLAVIGGFAAVIIGASLYLGSLIFNFFDFG